MRNPKRDNTNRVGRSQWYPYYAGYAPSFVEDAITCAKQSGKCQRILDPWNGSGTTTQVAAEHGLNAVGYDLNPVMVIVARARLLDANVLPSVISLLDDICVKAEGFDKKQFDDPLSHWLSASSARAFRAVDYAISVLLVDATRPFVASHLSNIDSISSLASYFYVALFRTLRTFLKSFESSNPTWIKDAKIEQARLKIPRAKIMSTFRVAALAMYRAVESDSPPGQRGVAVAAARLGRSTQLPVTRSSFDLVVSSPPYCTRIDYVVKTKPELAILGYDDASLKGLRNSMLGTPTILTEESIHTNKWGSYCEDTVSQIGEHSSRASRSYYLKTYVQYFDGLYKSIEEIGRVLTGSGLSFLVVQNSYYKDVHVDLARVANEMALQVGFEIHGRFNFSANRSMARLNSAAREYHDKHEHVESILVWRKAG